MTSAHRIVACLTLAWMSTVVAAESPAAKHPFGIEDDSALHSAHAVAVAPDGKEILYDLRTDGDKGPTDRPIGAGREPPAKTLHGLVGA
jgi:hypothetical protein